MSSYPLPQDAALKALFASASSGTDDSAAGSPDASGSQPPDWSALIAMLKQLVESKLPDLDPTYVDNTVVAAMLTSLAVGERLTLPMLDPEKLSKQDALPYLFWGMLYDDWKPDPDTGSTLFLTGYGDRSKPTADLPNPPANLRKRMYQSAVTSDKIPAYSKKVTAFWTSLLSPANAGQPLMDKYLSSYFHDLYWDLHLGLKRDDIPDFAAQIGMGVNTVLAIATPTDPTLYQAYNQVRTLRPQLDQWLPGQLDAVVSREDSTTLAYWWMKNSQNGTNPNFRKKDVMFECFHDFVALSQWGNTLYGIMEKLHVNGGDPTIRAAFRAAMTASPDPSAPFDPLTLFVMEMYRTLNPNSASISVNSQPSVTNSPFDEHSYVFTLHADTGNWDLHWTNPDDFDPTRFLGVPTADQNGVDRSNAIGFASCPFDPQSYDAVSDQHVDVTNSVFGTAYGVVDEIPDKICDYAGYAPFGFGYRRCPGELLNVQVIVDLLTIVWEQQLEFVKLDIADPKQLPVGPLSVVPDVFGFQQASADDHMR